MLALDFSRFRSLASAQPADDPGLSEPPPPPRRHRRRRRDRRRRPAPPPRSRRVGRRCWRAARRGAHHAETARDRRHAGDLARAATASRPATTTSTRAWPRSTVTGPIGLFRTLTGDVGRANNFRVGLNLQLFTQDNFLIAGANGVKGDTNSRFSATSPSTTRRGSTSSSTWRCSTRRTRTRAPKRRRSAPIPRSSWRSATSAPASRGALPVAAVVRSRRCTSGCASSTRSRASASTARHQLHRPTSSRSFDLRHAEATRQRAAALPPQLRLRRRQLDRPPAGGAVRRRRRPNDACIRSRVVETFAYGIAPSRFRSPPPSTRRSRSRSDKVGLELIRRVPRRDRRR